MKLEIVGIVFSCSKYNNYLKLVNLLTWIRSCWIKKRRYAYGL